MDSYSRFSAVYPVPDGSISSAVVAFEATWVAQFWPPESVQGDQAFAKTEFTDYLKNNSISFRPVPSRRHHKNTLEPKHGIIRSIFLRLLSASPEADKTVLALHAVRISNDLYGSDTLSSFEIAKGYTKPINPDETPQKITEELVRARDILSAKRKLTLIMRTKATADPILHAGDLVQIFVKKGHEKRGRWLSPRVVLSVDTNAGTVSVPGSNGHKVVAAVEDTRPAIVEDDFAASIVESIDQLDESIHESIEALTENYNQETPLDACSVSSDEYHTIDDPSISLPGPGDRIEILWPLDNCFYPGVVSSVENNVHHINYEDGDAESLKLEDEEWRFGATLSSSSVFTGHSLISNEQHVLSLMLETLGNKSFMRHHAQGFQQAVLYKAYQEQELEFVKRVSRIPISEVPESANVISSHTIYKIKFNDDKSLKLKARIAPHGNEDSLKNDLRSECCMCSPSGVRIVLSIASLRGWRLSKADVKSAFLQTGKAQRDVYVVPPRESLDRRNRWLLLTAAYGLVNANAKWQDQSDTLLHELGLHQLPVVPQLFHIIQNGQLMLLVAKIVDDILVTGVTNEVDKFLAGFDARFELGTVAHGPGSLRFYGMNIVQNEDMTCSIDANDKLSALEPYPITRLRRRQTEEPLNSVEKSAFMSLNSSLGWLGLAASPFCAFYASHLQQKLPKATVSVLTLQANALRTLKKLQTFICYPRPVGGSHSVTIAIFADAGRLTDHGQLSYISGLLLGPLQKGSIFHVLSWMSHKSKRPVRSIGAAEILAASEAIDEGKTLKTALSTLLAIPVRLIIIVDSKDLYTSLSTRRNSIDRSIRADVNVIRFEFETGNIDELCWLPGQLNIADPGTKTDSPLCQSLQLLMHDGKLPLDISRHESRRHDRSLG